MDAINVFGAWHFRFIKFAGGEDSLWRGGMNTCSYMRLFIGRAIWLVLLLLANFMAVYTFVQAAVTFGIFFTYGTWSTQLFWDALGALPTFINVIAFFEIVVIFILACVLTCVALVAAWFHMKTMFSAAKYERNIPVLSAFMASSGVQIVSAWHNKICRPIKVEN